MPEIKPYTSTSGRPYVYDDIEKIAKTDPESAVAITDDLDMLQRDPLAKLLTAKVVKQLKGKRYKALYELISECKNFGYRIFFSIAGSTYWLLHSFKKKGNRTPTKELETAKNRSDDLKNQK